MYGDTNKVLENIRVHFGKVYSEDFVMSVSQCNKFATFKSDNYSFEVMAGFIQARVQSDFETSIEDRLEEATKTEKIEAGKRYRYTSRDSNGHIPIEYCLIEI